MLILQTFVERSGIADKILTAPTTDNAKQLIDTHTIDAAFIDYYIPSENGPSLIAHIRQNHPSARIALVSSSDEAENQTEAINAGAEACICTSYEQEEVEETVATLLESWK